MSTEEDGVSLGVAEEEGNGAADEEGNGDRGILWLGFCR